MNIYRITFSGAVQFVSAMSVNEAVKLFANMFELDETTVKHNAEIKYIGVDGK